MTIAGLMAAMPQLSHSHAMRLFATLFVLGATAFLGLILLAIRKRSPILSGSARLLGRVPSLRNWVDQRLQLVESVESALFDFHHDTPRLFWGSFLLNLASQCLAILEVCLVLRMLGAPINFFGALIVEGLTKLVNAAGNFNPGNVGTYETGTMLIGKLFNLGSASGLALAMARRLRSLFWTAVGCACLVALTRSRKTPAFAEIEKGSSDEEFHRFNGYVEQPATE